jgi:gliding motility-associated-like protein
LLVGVSDELEGQISVPPIICEDDEVTFSSDVPGTWSATCGDCIDGPTGTFAPAGTEEGTYDITFIPESFCPIESYATVTVSPSVSIGGGNVPVSMCVEASEVDFNTNVNGGVWTASCGDCITAEGLFNPASAGPGVVYLNYAVESGACSDSADYAVDINPVLSGALEDVAPLCVGSTTSLDFAYDPDIPEEYTTGNSGSWSSPDCPGCIVGAISGGFSANEVGTITVVYTFSSNCSTPIEGTVEVAPAVNATIASVPQLCESGDPIVLSAAEAGGVWSSDCGNCLNGNTFDPTVGAGDYTISYTIDDVCSDEDEILIDVVPQLNATIDLPNVVCIGSETWQAGVFIGGGEWSATIDGNPCIDCISPSGEIDLLTAGTGMLEVTHLLDGLCGDVDVVTMEIRGCSVETVNVFSPNEDGTNDALVFKNLPYFPGNTLRIFDRWGRLTYEAYNYQNTWRGEGASDGTYFYTLDIPGLESIQGTLTISRNRTE